MACGTCGQRRYRNRALGMPGTRPRKAPLPPKQEAPRKEDVKLTQSTLPETPATSKPNEA